MQSEYSRLMNSFGLKGGARDQSDSDSDSSEPVRKKRKERTERREHSPDEKKYVVNVGCINVHQNTKDDKGKVEYNSRVCKDPKMPFTFYTPEIKKALLVKVTLRYLNDKISMKRVSEVVITIGKKKHKMAGDQLGDNIKIEEMGVVDEIDITLE